MSQCGLKLIGMQVTTHGLSEVSCSLIEQREHSVRDEHPPMSIPLMGFVLVRRVSS